jgi:hypothetical protein
MKSGEVEITAIHEVERTGLPDQLIEDVHVVNTAWRRPPYGDVVANT